MFPVRGLKAAYLQQPHTADTFQVWHSEDPPVPHLKLNVEHPETTNTGFKCTFFYSEMLTISNLILTL